MSIVLTSDPILSATDAEKVLRTTSDTERNILVNALSQKFLSFTNRVQINQDLSTPIVENLESTGGDMLFLHAPVYTADFDTYDVQVEILYAGTVLDTWAASDSELTVVSTTHYSQVIAHLTTFPHPGDGAVIRVTYYGGWAVVPGDVLQGAITQANVDRSRQDGTAGLQSQGRRGGSVTLETAGLIQAVEDLWSPYRVVI